MLAVKHHDEGELWWMGRGDAGCRYPLFEAVSPWAGDPFLKQSTGRVSWCHHIPDSICLHQSGQSGQRPGPLWPVLTSPYTAAFSPCLPQHRRVSAIRRAPALQLALSLRGAQLLHKHPLGKGKQSSSDKLLSWIILDTASSWSVSRCCEAWQ